MSNSIRELFGRVARKRSAMRTHAHLNPEGVYDGIFKLTSFSLTAIVTGWLMLTFGLTRPRRCCYSSHKSGPAIEMEWLRVMVLLASNPLQACGLEIRCSPWRSRYSTNISHMSKPSSLQILLVE